MDEIISELRELCLNYIEQDERLSRQKLNFLGQREPRMVLIEGLKLLSRCIEIDSADKSGCTHNHDDKSVETILVESGIVCPGLPLIIPDGYKLIDNSLILLECFVRSSPASFEKKFIEDTNKLACIREDLAVAGVTLVPIVDGRCDYDNSFMPEWANFKFRDLLFKLLEYSNQNEKVFEESEYFRLCESLKTTIDKRSGMDSMKILKDARSTHNDEIMRMCHEGINPNMSCDDVVFGINSLFSRFRRDLESGKLKRNFQKVNPEGLIKEFSELYENLADSDDILTLSREAVESCPLMRFITAETHGHERGSETSTEYERLLSMLNKVKSLKLLNTRRRQLLNLDVLCLSSLIKQSKFKGLKNDKHWVGCCYSSVNDRLVSFHSTKEEFIRLLRNRKKSKVFRKVSFEELFRASISEFIAKIQKCLLVVGLSFEHYGLSEHLEQECHIPFTEFENFMKIGAHPIMYYTKFEDYNFQPSTEQLKNIQSLRRLSSVCLALTNSMKTSSVARLRQNQIGSVRYQVVECKEVFCQVIKLDSEEYHLLYQKTGESSRCYSIQGPDGHLISFYADPKRFFLPIFSDEVLYNMIDIMISWIRSCPDLKDCLTDIEVALRTLLLLMLTNPTKRNQKQVQSVRYLVMAIVSDFSSTSLMDKLREDLITPAEKVVYKLLRFLIKTIFGTGEKVLLSAKFKFMLNVSYLCHLITKETPDRLTDQIKCFEKFFEPKSQFGFFVNPKEAITPEEECVFYEQMKRFTSKEIDCQHTTPGVNLEAFSLMVSSFNNGTLIFKGEKKLNSLDPMTNSGCATALDLASNKSVVVNKHLNGERLLEYDFNKLLVSAVSQITESFVRKQKYKLSHSDYEYKVSKLVSRLVIGSKGEETGRSEDNLAEICFDGEEETSFFKSLEEKVNTTIARYRRGRRANDKGDGEKLTNTKGLHHLQLILTGKMAHLRKVILSEISFHLVEDFDPSCLTNDDMKFICEAVEGSTELSPLYFTSVIKDQCGLDEMAKNLCRKFFSENDWFSCMKMILLQMNANAYSGKYRHMQRQGLNFKFDWDKLEEDVRISERESNSESLSKALSLTKCMSAALKNLCFYSEESPTSYTSVGPDSGRLKFALSYKEQVGGNRELYIGDLRTKMFTRLIEDYFESFSSFFSGSCLNNDKEFENAILSMTINVREGFLNYSMDHSKWGPMMCPFLFLMFLQNLKLGDDQYVRSGKDHVSTLLTWHMHKLVEVPFPVVNAMMKSYVKSKLKLLRGSETTVTERIFRQYFEMGIVPSHISSLIDMGQGILHNASDFYGLLSERFINYCIGVIFGERPEAYTSSDDQITLFDRRLSDLVVSDPEEVLVLLEFQSHLSGLLNKFISPKSVAGRFAAEFKSRFYVWGEEVPLLTKFVSAALHNVKCKEPHQLCETIDTIADQAIANGVPVSLVNSIQRRTLDLLKYANFPLDPFLLNTNTDVKDWLDGSRGYRIQRLIEELCPNETKVVRKLVRKLHHKLKNGEFNEEFFLDLFNRDKTEAILQLGDLLGLEEDLNQLADVNWLNLNEMFPLRMVLRQKVVYPSVMTFQEERIPSLIKTLQNKLCSKFTRGAQKLLSEAINKSAFQSCISSGFIGLCKTLGSRCVRNKNRENLYIKKLLEDLTTDDHVTRVCNRDGITLYICDKQSHPEAHRDHICLLRPLLWDYICISLSNSFELGVWVLAEPTKGKNNSENLTLKHLNPCDYVARKPESSRLLEDKVNLNQVIQSVRRLYPKIFEDQLLPFMSDMSSKNMRWSPRIKFLDLCVLIDINSESLSLISHVVKWKRDEHYTVLFSDLANSHQRSDSSLVDEFVVSTRDVCKNFLKQVYFESFVREFVATTRTLGNFSWFPHKEMMPSEDGAEALGPFQSFVSKVVNKNVERPMFRNDLQFGFGWFSYRMGDVVCNAAMLIRQGLTNPKAFKSLKDLWDYMLNYTKGVLEFSISVDFTHNQNNTDCLRKFSLIFLVRCQLQNPGVAELLSCSHLFKGEIDRRMLDECLHLLRTDSVFKVNDGVFDIRSEEFEDYMEDPLILGDSLELELLGSKRILDGIRSIDFERVGPEWEPVPLTVKMGALFEGRNLVQNIIVKLETKDMKVFLAGLEGYEKISDVLGNLFLHRFRTGEHLLGSEISVILQELCIDRSILLIPLSLLPDWFAFKDCRLCFSKSRSTLMYEIVGGRFRLKGRSCDDWLGGSVAEDID
ncbi:L protein [Mammarenavirus choriomeningitidis]|uniref:RNA-directed RNA polymerase L n=7 Tax=Mammarenavirus choriomeningitidis TaxID=3052303 RepID=L_LYCVA|nr:L protein [Mammarenavirus choriomeningitidis]P14240.1 RecName: Full=RNA-directed RNA polymerase L; Short=Protein L; AltName: Full=Large structural protein; AltName: Full=Replicase; AltName: Full=Transcriptase; Includes: RecName: Full=cap-snatching endonuclease [Lymphocytic choriomeningitis virus (strain Armstrong)]AAA66591.1 L protein [Mammarenavirus choriomeningitidis]